MRLREGPDVVFRPKPGVVEHVVFWPHYTRIQFMWLGLAELTFVLERGSHGPEEP